MQPVEDYNACDAPKKGKTQRRRETIKFLESFDLLQAEFSIDVEELKKIDLAVSRIAQLYELFGVSPRQSNMRSFCDSKKSRRLRLEEIEVTRSYRTNVRSLCRVVSLNGEGSWVSILKWKFAAFFSYHRKEDIPPRPDLKPGDGRYSKCVDKWMRPQNLLGGYYHDWLLKLQSREYDHFMEFTDTVQQLKKGMPCVPDSMIEAAIKKTVTKLTSPPVQEQVDSYNHNEDMFFFVDDRVRLVDYSIQQIKEQLIRTTDELFFDLQLDPDELMDPFFPSTSANYINSRNKGGAVSEIYDKYPEYFCSGESLLDTATVLTECRGYRSPHFGERGLKEDRDYEKNCQILGFEPTEKVASLYVDDTRLKSKWRNFYTTLLADAMEERPLVSPVGLAEPLKVRVISKGPPLTYTVLKPWQQLMWRILKKFKVFNLIGRYVLEDDINWCIGELADDEVPVSGDYQASTDNLHSWVSDTILDRFMLIVGENFHELCEMPPNYIKNIKELFRRALSKHIFVYDGQELPQQEGQLMGSIISFPFLCIANGALCRYALEQANGCTYRLRERRNPHGIPLAPLLINGDDCLFKGKSGLIRPIWENVCRVAGLLSSVGKTYFSREFCTINSTIFQYCQGLWVERKYINLGLLHGNKRSVVAGSENGTLAIGQFGVICRELKRSCPPRLWPRVKKEFIHAHLKDLKKFSLPWFVPEWLGGLGLPMDDPAEISALDRRACTFILMNWNKSKLKVAKHSQESFWIPHRHIMRRLRETGVPLNTFDIMCDEGEEFSIDQQYNKIYKLMAIDLLFTTPFESIVDRRPHKVNNKVLLNNEDLFREARKKSLANGYEPMADEEMKHQVKEFLPPCRLKVLHGLRTPELVTPLRLDPPTRG